jgi:hypothetical protein
MFSRRCSHRAVKFYTLDDSVMFTLTLVHDHTSQTPNQKQSLPATHSLGNFPRPTSSKLLRTAANADLPAIPTEHVLPFPTHVTASASPFGMHDLPQKASTETLSEHGTSTTSLTEEPASRDVSAKDAVPTSTAGVAASAIASATGAISKMITSTKESFFAPSALKRTTSDGTGH